MTSPDAAGEGEEEGGSRGQGTSSPVPFWGLDLEGEVMEPFFSSSPYIPLPGL